MQIGGAIVPAVVGAVLSSSGSADVHHRLLPGMTDAIAVVVGVSLVALLLTAAVLARDRWARDRLLPGAGQGVEPGGGALEPLASVG